MNRILIIISTPSENTIISGGFLLLILDADLFMFVIWIIDSFNKCNKSC